MTNDDFQRVQPVIAMAQRIHVKAHGKLAEKGVQPIDTLIASIYAAHQIATELHGHPVAAIEWMRTAIDTIERQALAAGGRVQ